MSPLDDLTAEIITCRRCPRLVAWREEVGKGPPRRYAGQEYWSRPLPGFGDAPARVFIVGLAPAAHGSNRTGRVFTGDRSGDWLFRALFRAGFANQEYSASVDDGLQLRDCRIVAACRCAPPANKPLPQEMQNCREYLLREMQLMPQLRVLVGLGKIGFEAAFDAARALNYTALKSRPRFAHGTQVALSERLCLIGTFHPSQQNTFTGRLTEPMLDAIFEQVKKQLAHSHDS